jgi:hypothetical protein
MTVVKVTSVNEMEMANSRIMQLHCTHEGCNYYLPPSIEGEHWSFYRTRATRAGWMKDIYARFFCPECAKKHLI